MMDYYSSFPAPSIEERKKRLLLYAKDVLKCTLDESLIKTVEGIVSQTKDYSYTGYTVFGIQEENSSLLKVITS